MSSAGGSHLVYKLSEIVVIYGSVNSIPPGQMSGICHLVGPGGGEFVSSSGSC